MQYACKVTFDILIPQDLQSTPYIAFRSYGIHSHPPPPPAKISADITYDIAQLVHRMNDSDLTLGE